MSEELTCFLQQIIAMYLKGSRGPEFAEWAATKAIFMLEFEGLPLRPFSPRNSA